MTRERALHLLSLPQGDHAPATIRSAAAYALRAAHPDTGGYGDVEAVKKARDFLLAGLADGPSALRPCMLCRGAGSIAQGLSRQTCASCSGSGERGV